MNDQMTFTTEEGEKIILAEEVEKKEKAAAEYLKARSRARAAIKDAKLRYIKEKTRARSKKAAEERDEILNSPRFKVLEQFDRFAKHCIDRDCDSCEHGIRGRSLAHCALVWAQTPYAEEGDKTNEQG